MVVTVAKDEVKRVVLVDAVKLDDVVVVDEDVVPPFEIDVDC